MELNFNFDKDAIINSAKDLYTGDKKYIVWGISGVLVLTLLAMVIWSVVPKKSRAPSTAAVFAADEDLLIPDGPQSQVTSVTSRAQGKTWGEKDAKRFLTVPGTAELDDLSDANDRMINDILSAAP